MLFKRVVNGAGEGHWQEVELGSALFAQAATPAQGVSGVTPLKGPAQSLTGERSGRVDRRQHAGAWRRQ